jgi:hypothetical protein
MFPAFTNFALLAGLAAIVAPILIHLLLKRKSQRLRFSTIQFFLKQDEQSMRKRKLRNLLLLATRCLIYALIVLAFARPFLRDRAAGADGRPRKQLVLLLDASASMQAEGPAGKQWTRAKDLARQELSKLQSDDRVALVICSTRSEVAQEFAPVAATLAKLDALEPTFGAAKLEEGLRQVTKVLATANPAHSTSLCIISDLQRSGSENLANTPLPRDVAIRTVDLGERFIPNLAVTALQMESTEQGGPHAVLTSFSDENHGHVPFKLKIDGQQVLAGSIALEAGAVTNFPLAVPTLAPGWHSAEFVVETKDALRADDTAYATLFVPPPIYGVVVETRATTQIFMEESYFVATALNPVREEGKLSPSRFSYSKTSLDSLPQKLKPDPGQPGVEYVIVPAVKSFPAQTLAALKEFVQGGGGLMLFVGANSSPIGYGELGELLPAQIARVESSGEAESGWHIANFDAASAIFAVFREPNSGNVFLPEFTHRFVVTPTPGSKVVAEFEDGMPLIVARNAGQGRVVLVNTSADTAWTDWQKHKTFVPWLHASARYLSRRDDDSEREPAPMFVSGTEVEFDLAIQKSGLKLQHQSGPEVNLTTDTNGVAQDVRLETPGIYSIKDTSGRELRRIAANIANAESELATLAPPEVEQQLVKESEPTVPSLSAGLFGDPTRGKELWRALLLVVLMLLLFEPVLANRMFA